MKKSLSELVRERSDGPFKWAHTWHGRRIPSTFARQVEATWTGDLIEAIREVLGLCPLCGDGRRGESNTERHIRANPERDESEMLRPMGSRSCQP